MAAYLTFFRDRGHRVRWVTLGRPPQDPPDGIEVIPISRTWPGRGFSWRKLGRLADFRSLRRILQTAPPDLVHAHFLSSAGVLATLAGARPLAVTVHGSDLMGSPAWLRRAGARLVGRRADLLNPVSHELEEVLLGLGIPPARILRAGMGIDVQRVPFEPRAELRQPPRLLCTRFLEDVYDPVTLVEAVALLRDRGRTVHLTFAADGSLSASLTRRIADLGLASRIELRGGYRPEELEGLMAASDLYVSASLRDGTSVSLLEALAGGLYPVVSDIPANRPWISCGSDGQLFRPGDPHDLAGAVERALDVADRAAVLRCNRQRVATQGDRGTGFSALEARFAQLVEATASA